MKKYWWVVVLILLIGAGGYLNYFTTVFDSREKAIVIEKHGAYNQNFDDKQVLYRASDHIFIGEVVEEKDTEMEDGIPHTLFSVRVTQNIKGAILGDITVVQPGGYYKRNGKLYLLRYKDEPLLDPGQMYFFAATKEKESERYMIIPKYGDVPVDTEEQKLELIEELSSYISE